MGARVPPDGQAHAAALTWANWVSPTIWGAVMICLPPPPPPPALRLVSAMAKAEKGPEADPETTP